MFRHLRGWFMRAAGYVERSRHEQEFADELESHLQMHVDDGIRAGHTPEEARRIAIVKLGGVEQVKEGYRAQRGIPALETVVKDTRYAIRKLRKTPGFTVVAVASLALGIGANTAIFSLVNTAALRPLPVENPEQIVAFANINGNRGFPTFSYPNYRDFRDRNEVFSGLLAYRFAPLSISHDGINERLWGYVVTGNYFDVLGVKARLGRTIASDDDVLAGAHPVTVLSHDCWERRFGADPGIVGKNVIVNGKAYTVIGVAARDFFGTEIIAAPEMWFPMAMQAEIEAGYSWLEKRGVENLFIQGRLKPDVSTEQAQAAISAIAAQLENDFPNENTGMSVRLSKPGFMGGLMRGAVISFTGVLLVVVAFVLILACTNLANLLLARVAERRKEMAVRLALGASRGRLVRQLLTESLLLALVSGVIGWLLAYWLLQAAQSLKPPVDAPLLVDFRLDHRVFLFTCVISVATGLLFGLAPALAGTKVDLQTGLKDDTAGGGFRRSWFKRSLIVFQIALSLVLLAGGGLMLRALGRAQAIDLGFRPENAVEASFDLRIQGYSEDRGLQFQNQLLDRLRALPDVQQAGIVDLAPVDLHFSRVPVFVEGVAPERIESAPRAMTSRASPGYFQAMRTRIVLGRDFTLDDDAGSTRVAIVNEAFVRRFWPGSDPLGRQFSIGNPDSPLLQVIGVVEDGKYGGLYEEQQAYVCRPLAQAYAGTNTVIVRSQSDPRRMLADVRKVLSQLDPTMPLASARPLADRMAMPLLPARLAALVFGCFGFVALALAAIGLYGVMSNAILSRTREIGVRVALGARSSDILLLVLGEGMMLVAVGMGLGLAAAFVLMGFVKGFLFGVSSVDPLTYVVVSCMLTGIALLACYIPARRASKTDPMIALRYD